MILEEKNIGADGCDGSDVLKADVNLDVLIQQQNLADYRVGFYLALNERLRRTYLLACGDSSFAGGQKSVRNLKVPRLILRNIFFGGHRLLFQLGYWRLRLSVPLLVSEFNYRTLSTWVLVCLRRFSGKTTVLWGHAQGRRQSVLFLRKLLFTSVDGFICYTQAEREKLIDAGFSFPIGVAFNACMHASDMFSAEVEPVNSFLFSGRMVSGKKPCLAMHAFAMFLRLSSDRKHMRLIYLGDGDELSVLMELAEKLDIQQQVDFLGHEARIDVLREVYGRSLASLSPGYVGLSAMQSFGFGVPMIINRYACHSPEISVCREGRNALFYDEGTAAGLAAAMESCYRERSIWKSRRPKIQLEAKENHSFEAMAEGFASFIEEY